MQKNDYEKTCTKKHEKHVQKTRTEKTTVFFCVFIFFSRAENKSRKNKGAENKPSLNRFRWLSISDIGAGAEKTTNLKFRI